MGSQTEEGGSGMIREIRKSNSEKIVISKSVYRGRERVDIRVHYFDVDSGEWRPTKKGVSFQPELLEEVVGGLKDVAR
jgi:hypothetical protein